MRYETFPADTTRDAARIQFAALRRLSAAQRAEMTMDLCHEVHQLSIAGVRRRHPNYNEGQVEMAVLRLTIGEALFQEVFAGVEIEP